jgi:hypothetical protein
MDNVGKHVDGDGNGGGEGDGGGDEDGDGHEDGDGDGDGDGEDGDGDDDDGSEDIEVDEELVGYGKDHTPNVNYDKNDPPMTVSTMYPNMKEFKVSLSQHAIKHMDSNSILRRVHHLDTGSIAQGETKTIVHRGYMHLQCRICTLLL